MASFSDTAKNNMLDNLDAGGTLYVSLHTADPGKTGASEATGGSYARKTLAMSAAASGSMSPSGAVTLDVPAGTYTHLGIWTAVSGGTFLCGGALDDDEVYANAGTFEVGTATAIAIPD